MKVVSLPFRLRSVVPICGIALLSACSQVPIKSMPLAPMEPPPSTSAAHLPPYHIQVGDVLDVKLMLNPEFNEEVTVRPDGHISAIDAPDALAVGRTPDQLAGVLEHAYARDLTVDNHPPRLSVEVKSFAPTRIYVGGEVAQPGELITIGPSLTLSQAIARAGGTKLSADDQKVFIIRRDANDIPQFLATDWDGVRQGRDRMADVRLAPYDVVYVPRTGVAEVYKWYNQDFQQYIAGVFSASAGYAINPTVVGH